MNTEELLDMEGYSLIYWNTWRDADVPTGGDDTYLSNFSTQHINYDVQEDNPAFVELRYTGWGDYVGDTVTRSNHRVLLANFRDEVIDASGDFGYSVLLVPLGVEMSEGLAETLRDLAGYPAVDEDDCSNLQWELAEEDWEDWAADDVRGELIKITGDDSWGEVDNETLWGWVTSSDSFYLASESAVSGLTPDSFRGTFDDVIEARNKSKTGA